MIKILKLQRIPNILIILKRIRLEDSPRVVTWDNMAENLNVNVRVTEGDALSVILFNLVLNYIRKKLDIRGIYQLNWYRSMHLRGMQS